DSREAENKSLRSKPMQSRSEIIPEEKNPKLSWWDVAYALNMAIACLITYWIITHALSRFVDEPSDFLGGMWAVAATVFVFRETRLRSLSAGTARLIATCVSFALCLLYLVLFPFTPVGMAVLIAVGTAVMALLGRRDDIVTVGITTVVVMVVAAMSPVDAWQQPVLRLADTMVGIAVGVACKCVGSFLFLKLFGEQEGVQGS
ncbi:MAG TPA: FUSC family protein, partial [Xanthobacteraceae bacterium]|nr:FUSC family protein [Xanthobacteraceae bacterium]